MVVGGGGAAGVDGDVLLLGVGHQVRVQARSDDELAPGGNGGVDVGLLRDGSGAYNHLRAGLPHESDGLVRAGGPEGDLRDRDVSGAEGAGQRGRIPLRVFQLDDRDYSDVGDGLVQWVHGDCSSLKYMK